MNIVILCGVLVDVCSTFPEEINGRYFFKGKENVLVICLVNWTLTRYGGCLEWTKRPLETVRFIGIILSHKEDIYETDTWKVFYTQQ